MLKMKKQDFTDHRIFPNLTKMIRKTCGFNPKEKGMTEEESSVYSMHVFDMFFLSIHLPKGSVYVKLLHSEDFRLASKLRKLYASRVMGRLLTHYTSNVLNRVDRDEAVVYFDGEKVLHEVLEPNVPRPFTLFFDMFLTTPVYQLLERIGRSTHHDSTTCATITSGCGIYMFNDNTTFIISVLRNTLLVHLFI